MAFGGPEELESALRGPSEVLLTAEASVEEVREILERVEHIAGVEIEEKPSGLTAVRLHTDAEDVHDVSRALFFAFAWRQRALLEISLKRAGLEDIFIELTEDGGGSPGAADTEESEASEL